jgi:hypothetical protein
MTHREPQPPDVPVDPSGIEQPHDVLAADEFGIGTRDDRLPPDPSGRGEPHDILAADEFGIGTRDDRLPPDPSGRGEPHDILAAEEFAMPAGGEPHEQGSTGPDPRTLVPLLLIAALLAFLLVRRRG